MAFGYIPFDDQTPGGRKLRRLLQQAEESDDAHPDVLSMMVMMRDGDDNDNDTSNYAEVVRQFGFGGWKKGDSAPSAFQCGKAREAYLELASAYSKISGDGSVSAVRTARDQLFAKLRG